MRAPERALARKRRYRRRLRSRIILSFVIFGFVLTALIATTAVYLRNQIGRAHFYTLFRSVWGTGLPAADSLRVHIHALRAVVEKPFPIRLIQTRHGIGYRIAEPDAST